MRAVPKCENCQHLECVDMTYKSYYCIKAMNRSLGVDTPPFRSPKWCPLRLKERKLHISKIYHRLYQRDRKFVITLYHEFSHDIATSVCTRIFMNILKRCEARNIKVWGTYECNQHSFDKYTLDYNAIIFHLTSCLDYYVCQKFGQTLKSYELKTLFRYYDLLLRRE